MLFNSIEFAVFLPFVFFLYWFLAKRTIKIQNILLLGASYLFYGWWDWRFLSLIIFSSFIDFLVGVQLGKSNHIKTRKILLTTSILVNLGFLGFFKYFNFFVESFTEAFTLLGQPLEASRLNIILPVGISFYTFQTLSYSIDVYRKKLEPTQDVIAFFTFVSFFPQLVAGPIERATNLLPQFYKRRLFDTQKAVDGMRQILWGLFKKVVIADNCAIHANQIFNNSEDYSGSTLIFGALMFTFQIYGDFSGYSDIAIGTSRLFGFNLKQNFAFPYFSRDIAEFWRRWHISLSTWFRDYLYIPLGGSKGSQWRKTRNVFIIFIASGFWHGANWTFIVWGLLNAVYFLPLLLTNRNRNNTNTIAEGKTLPNFRELMSMLGTFVLTVFAWVFFRADNLSHALQYVMDMFTLKFFDIQLPIPYLLLFFVFCFLFIEWFGRFKAHALEELELVMSKRLRWTLYMAFILAIYLSPVQKSEFIYFQF
tara:strand:- start:2657 stop:4093 length:1437 start_codon:yes stop_codon:yes gene_type:complete